jgi:hypothetical protein
VILCSWIPVLVSDDLARTAVNYANKPLIVKVSLGLWELMTTDIPKRFLEVDASIIARVHTSKAVDVARSSISTYHKLNR